jgi:hypothetical protein
MYGLAIMDVLMGLLSLGLCIPLVQCNGRNAAYGFRTRKTLASDKAWYAVNHGAAKAGVYMPIDMVIFGIVVALLLPIMGDNMQDCFLCAALVAPLVLALGLVVAREIALKKLDKSDSEEML